MYHVSYAKTFWPYFKNSTGLIFLSFLSLFLVSALTAFSPFISSCSFMSLCVSDCLSAMFVLHCSYSLCFHRRFFALWIDFDRSFLRPECIFCLRLGRTISHSRFPCCVSHNVSNKYALALSLAASLFSHFCFILFDVLLPQINNEWNREII